MFGSRTVLAAIGVITLGALSVSAQTTAEREKVRACTNTVRLANPSPRYSWEYDDPAFFNVTYNYDPQYCDSTVPVNYIRLSDYVGGGIYTCTREQFAPTRSTVYAQCRLTHGEMAIQARDEGYDDWSIEINLGARAQFLSASIFDTFLIDPPPEETPAPTPSGAMKKRNAEAQHKFDCPTGQTYCWTGERQEYACMDTSSDVTACGRCPYAPGSESDGPGDCTSIESADDVQCINSRCVVNACQRGFQVSLDRTKCLDGKSKKRSIIARGVLF